MIGAGGILLVDKPAGVTSFAVVNRIRRTLVDRFPELAPPRGRSRRGGPKPPRFKCGHAGTLDPLATGLLVVLVGKGSRLSPFLMGLDKRYLATIRFGTVTDTLDREGEVTATEPAPASSDVVASCLTQFRGEIQQVPPLISALKRDGRALHRRVRAGEDVAEPDARPVTIHELAMTDVRWDAGAEEVDIDVSCSSGTYIRSLARDLAEAAGSVGHIAALRRLRIGPFGIADAIEGAMERDGADLAAAMKPLADALPHLPRLTVTDDEASHLRTGGQPAANWLSRLPNDASGCTFRMVDAAGALVAVGRLDETTGHPHTAVVIGERG